jgi:FkbM family methyltransferase
MMSTGGDSGFGTARAIYTRIVRAIFPTLNPHSYLQQAIEITRTIFPILDPHYYLKQVTGVIHVGANVGQERERYARYKLKVLWIEPLSDVFEQLCKNIKSFPDQAAVNYLITDKDDVEYLFHVANNGGQSSSILDLARHSEVWPDVHYVSKVTLKSITLDTLLTNIGDGISSYQVLVMDTQGSELLVLKGATKSLGQFKFIRTEAADFEAYTHCARVEELTSYLRHFGFRLILSEKNAESPKGGRYYDLLYWKS